MRNLPRILCLLIPLLLLSMISHAIDPPTKLWEKWYYTDYDFVYFRDMEITQTGNLFITGLIYDYTPPVQENYVAILMDQNGNILWEVPHEFAGASGYDSEVLPDGSFIITGGATPDSSSTTAGLYIHKISADGSTEWAKVYDYPSTKETGYGITCLPDGGFAVVGRVNGTGSVLGDAWILRTDSSGDTLWTDIWGDHTVNYGKSIEFVDNTVCALFYGKDDTLSRGTNLLCYDLEGNYLWGKDYPDTNQGSAIDMCLASDGGFTFVSQYYYSSPRILHTDRVGNLLWYKVIYVSPNDDHESFCIRQTMDSGYIFSGWDGYNPGPEDDQPLAEEIPQAGRSSDGNDYDDYQEGWLVRFDSEGNELWNINNTVSVDHHFYSCLQLPQGGYMACGTWGGSGYLIRYAPETGIELEEPSPIVTMDVSPNPFSSQLSVSFTLPEAGNASVRIYDLSGRLISTVVDGLFPTGSNSVEWSVPEELSSGCYFVRYISDLGSVSELIILIK